MVSELSVFLSLINNLSVFIVLVAGYGLLAGYLKKFNQYEGQIVLGLFFGLITIGAMHVKIPVADGVIVDQRNAIVALSGAFGGPISAILCAMVAGAYRVYLGGAGSLAGVIGVCLSAVGGILLFRFRAQMDSVPKTAFSAVVLTIIILPGFLFVGSLENGWELLKRMALPYGSAIFVGLFLGCLMLDREDRRHRVEAEKKLSDERFRSIVDNSPYAISLKDVEGYYLLVNRHFEDLAGITRDDIIGKTPGQIFDREFAQAGIDHDRDVVKSRRAIQRHEKFETGERVFYLLTTKFPVFGNNGEIIAVGGVHIDISESKQVEEERQTALVDAERANQAKTEFLATMSHELRTPLNAILGFSEMLRAQYFGPLGDKNYQVYASDIHDSGAQLLALINDILDISAIEAGKRPMAKEAINIDELLGNCIKNFEHQARDGGIELALEISEGLPFLYVDKRSAMQIFLNLLSNAIKFTEREGEITVSAIAADQHMIIRVSDTGVGISPDNLPSITEPFSQGHSDPHVTQNGTGLGLSIVESLVDANDGELNIESEVGKGTIVSVTFPIQKPATD
jgi:PAS domain S-box-containing protein